MHFGIQKKWGGGYQNAVCHSNKITINLLANFLSGAISPNTGRQSFLLTSLIFGEKQVAISLWDPDHPSKAAGEEKQREQLHFMRLLHLSLWKGCLSWGGLSMRWD